LIGYTTTDYVTPKTLYCACDNDNVNETGVFHFGDHCRYQFGVDVVTFTNGDKFHQYLVDGMNSYWEW
jgi:hypothetical protein